MTNYIRDRYFDWLMDIVCRDYFEDYRHRYKTLLKFLLTREYFWSIPKDENRFTDGLQLRDTFLYENPDAIDDFEAYFDPSTCSILEVMVALAQRCESIMANDSYGDRTSRWFWDMIDSLNLWHMSEGYFDREYVKASVYAALNHDYNPDGRGGLFTIPGTRDDLRNVELWYQMCWYLNYIIDSEGE